MMHGSVGVHSRRGEICRVLEVSSGKLDVMLYRLCNRTRSCLEARKVELEA